MTLHSTRLLPPVSIRIAAGSCGPAGAVQQRFDSEGVCFLRSARSSPRSLAFSGLFLSIAAGLLTLALPAARLTRPAVARAEGGETLVASTRSVNCAVDGGQLGLDGEEQYVVDQTNAYRAQNGLPALVVTGALQRVALWKANDIAQRVSMQHDDGFRSWQQRFSDCGYDYLNMNAQIGENLAAGNAAGAGTLNQWQSSPMHNANLLNGSFTAIGVKRVQGFGAGDPYHWYWTMELGSIDTGPDAALDLVVP